MSDLLLLVDINPPSIKSGGEITLTTTVFAPTAKDTKLRFYFKDPPLVSVSQVTLKASDFQLVQHGIAQVATCTNRTDLTVTGPAALQYWLYVEASNGTERGATRIALEIEP